MDTVYTPVITVTVTEPAPKYTMTIAAPHQNITAAPVFKTKLPMTYSPALVQTTGGSITRVRGEGEAHTLTATPKDCYVFTRWEQSTDNGSTWTTIPDAGASCGVTLTANTSYRAIFTPISIQTLSVKNYALTAAGSDWFINLDTKLNTALTDTTAFTVDVYEGNDANGTKLGTATVNSYSGSQELVLKAPLTQRPTTATSNIFVVVTLPNGQKNTAAYTLKGTLDVSPATFSVDTVKALFLGTEPTSYQLSVTGEPAPAEAITYSGKTGAAGSTFNYMGVDKNGLVTFSRFYNAAGGSNVTFTADAGDGRIAVSTGTVKNGDNAIKLSANTLQVPKGESKEFAPEKSSTAATAYTTDNTKVISSNEEIFTASITAKAQGRYQNIVDQIVIKGIAVGEATLTLQVGKMEWSCKVAITSPETPVEEVTLTLETATLQTGDTVRLSAEATPATASTILWWTSSDSTVATVSESGLVTGKGAGIATITVTAKDGLKNTVTDTCTVTVTDEAYQVKVYVPKNTVGEDGLKFYPTTGVDSDNRDTFQAGSAISATKSTEDPNYDVYSLALKQGTYSFRATDASGKSLGGSCFQIPAEKNGGGTENRTNTPIYLRKVEAYVLNTTGAEGETKAAPADFSVEMSNKLGSLTLGAPYTDEEGYGRYPVLAYVNGNALLYYTNFTPSADYAAAHQVGTIMHINNAIARGTGTAEVKITLPTTTTFTINAPKGADVALYNQLKNYNTVRINWNSTEAQSDGTVDYIFNVAKSNSMSYRVSMEGKRTQVGFFSNAFGPTVELADRIVVDFGSGSPTEQGSSGTYNGESSLLLNLNERNKLNLTVGESYKLRGYRAAWQLVNDVSANIMIEPDFHYTVLSGADVIEITPTTGGNAKDNWAWIKAKSAGVAVVEVTYDALDPPQPRWISIRISPTPCRKKPLPALTVVSARSSRQRRTTRQPTPLNRKPHHLLPTRAKCENPVPAAFHKLAKTAGRGATRLCGLTARSTPAISTVKPVRNAKPSCRRSSLR